MRLHGNGAGGEWALTAAILLMAICVSGHQMAVSEEEESEESEEEESDSAPFMVSVEHEGGQWRCGGALVSSHTVLSSLWCARGPDRPPRALWAVAAAAATGHAPRAHGARRVATVASAGRASASRGRAWGGALHDMALLELEAPFGSAAAARPILMALEADDCSPTAACHVVQSLPAADSLLRLRIADAAIAPEQSCAPRVEYWAAAKAKALCVEGPELCARDWGGGVVCGGKLCGVVSRALLPAGGSPAGAAAAAAATGLPAAGGAGSAAAAAEVCGTTLVAQSVPRWRHFLQCAHTLRSCGRGACQSVCTEQRLLQSQHSRPSSEGGGGGLRGAKAEQAVSSAAPTRAPSRSEAESGSGSGGESGPEPPPPPPPRTSLRPPPPPTRLPPSPPPPHKAPLPIYRKAAPIPAPESPPPPISGQRAFEPYRPDFRGGEYGDNALDYGADDAESINSSSTIGVETNTTTTSSTTVATTMTSPTSVATPPTTATIIPSNMTTTSNMSTTTPSNMTTTIATQPKSVTMTSHQNNTKSSQIVANTQSVTPEMRSKGVLTHIISPFIYFIICIPVLLYF